MWRRSKVGKPELPTSKTGKRNLKYGLDYLRKKGYNDRQTWSRTQGSQHPPEVMVVMISSRRTIDTAASKKRRSKPVMERWGAQTSSSKTNLEHPPNETQPHSSPGQATLHHEIARIWPQLLDLMPTAVCEDQGSSAFLCHIVMA